MPSTGLTIGSQRAVTVARLREGHSLQLIADLMGVEPPPRCDDRPQMLARFLVAFVEQTLQPDDVLRCLVHGD